ncbi:hypothetical protein GOB94_08740 [Granulicella sp. 5B5]|uniref:hypothetical protein n=1 Tax=Granulicella sp. 5B5 TaxID=1617967 RepID=UPI0015F3E4C1|nr:hypothetical protein [Granulicella sp. 5B5]QMV18758.1 hypothetical protein GOB94_08740 [Granulicella sp. 5B5]
MTLRTSLATLAAAALLTTPALSAAPRPAQPHAISPCALLTPDQIKVVLGTPVLNGKPGTSGASPGSADCTWADAHGETRIYLQVKDATPDYHDFRNSMQATGRLVPVTGLAEDAFYISATGSSAALYFLKAHHVMLLTVDGVGFSKAQNEAAERGLATQVLPKL